MRELHTLITKAVVLSAVLLAVTLTLSVAAPTILARPAWADDLAANNLAASVLVAHVPATNVPAASDSLADTSNQTTPSDRMSANEARPGQAGTSYSVSVSGYLAAEGDDGGVSPTTPPSIAHPAAKGDGKTGLPQTGDKLEAWIALTLIAALLIILGIIALRQGNSPTSPEIDPNDEDTSEKQ